MVREYDVVSLGDVTSVRSGFAFKSSDWTETGIPVVKIASVKEGRLVMDSCSFVPPQVAESAAEFSLRAGDILIAMTGYIGDVARVREHDLPAVLNQRVGRFEVRDFRRLDQGFLFYLLRDPDIRKEIEGLGYGSAQPNVSPSLIHEVEVPLPPLREQRAIAHFLGTLDDKIELNRRMNETLEEMARALFKSWFVDFEPIRAKAEGRDTGLPQSIADLFPDSFEDSELGEIPRGWGVAALGELIDTVKGRSYRSEELVESDTALVTLKSFARGGGYRPDGLKSFAGTYKAEQIVSPGELVIACTDVTQAAEVIGRPAIVRSTSGYQRLVASLDTLIVRPRDSSMTRAYLYFLGGTEAFVAHTYAHTTGTTVLHLAKEAIPSFTFARPSTRLVEKFDILADVILDRIQALEEESGTLAALRDALLPKLISGELRIQNPDRLVPETARAGAA